MPDRSSAVRRFGTVLALVALFVLGLPAGAQASTYSVGVTLGSPTVLMHRAVSVSGTVSGKPSGRTVYLQRKSSGKWQNVANTKLSKSGGYKFSLSPTSAGSWSLRVYKPKGSRKAGYSRTLTLHVVSTTYQLTLAAASRGGFAKSSTAKPQARAAAVDTSSGLQLLVVLSGSVTPPDPYARLVVERLLNGTWTGITESTLDANSNYFITTPLDTSIATSTYRVTIGGDENAAGASSAPVTVSVPALGPRMSQVAMSDTNHSCGVTEAGAVLCWGGSSGAAEQDPVNPGASYPSSTTPVPVRGLTSGIRSVAVGEGFACALTTAGAVQCWGSNGWGQLGNGSNVTQADYPTPVSGLSSGVQAIAAGANNVCALTTAGSVLCWGDFPGDGSTPPPYTYAPTARVPVQVSGLTSGVRAITAGREFSCAVLDSGEARCWGSGGPGELGDGDSTEANAYTPVTVTGGHRYVAISGGANFACAVTTTGTVDCWGQNNYAQLGTGTGTGTEIIQPVAASGISGGATAVAAGGDHACALVNGGVQCWGNLAGPLTLSQEAGVIGGPTSIPGLTSSAALIAVSGQSSCAISTGDAVVCWGANPGNGRTDFNTPQPYPLAPVYVRPPAPNSGTNFATVAAGDDHACAITKAGAVLCWGANTYGQLGNGTKTSSTTPVAVTGLTSGVVSIGAGLGFTCAITSDGAVHCWGRDDYGMLGNGTTTASSVPVTVSGAANMRTVSAGTGTACAVSAAGGVSCWGDNGSGELGDAGSEPNSATAVAVSGLGSGVRKVSVGSLATCALLNIGGLKCWGDGFYGELATRLQAASSNVPVDIAGFTSGVADVAVGYEHVCAVRTVGTVACWGQNDQGEDTGPNSINYSPIDVPGLSNVAAISGNGPTTCALTTPGGVFCWGAEALGDDGQGVQNLPQPAYDLSSGATSLASGGSQRCAVMKDGSISYWGALVPPSSASQVPRPL
ncbi:MAG TPA: hypothetical protein VHV82_15830 [Sporichthyaceae bacterium]|nr:hypothetical protein [Sporichthyaceae bacterium]